MTDKNDGAKPGMDEARARMEQIEIRLGGLFDVVTNGLKDISDQMGPLGQAVRDAAERGGHVSVQRHVTVGSLGDFLEAKSDSSSIVPEHSISQSAEHWSLNASLPDTRLTEIEIDLRPGTLILKTRRHRLECLVPDDMDPAGFEMHFQAGQLSLRVPRIARPDSGHPAEGRTE